MFIRPKESKEFLNEFTVADSTTLAGKLFQLFIVCMWLIDFVVMAPGGSICLISEKIIDINIKMLVN